MSQRQLAVAIGAAIASALVAAVVVGRAQQSFYSDAALQMKTVVQYTGGGSPRVNDWIRLDYDDLSRDTDERLVIWALGLPLAFLPLVRAGLTPAAAARAVATIARSSPARFEENGTGAAIRAWFPQAARWTSSSIAGAELVVWTAQLEASGDH